MTKTNKKMKIKMKIIWNNLFKFKKCRNSKIKIISSSNNNKISSNKKMKKGNYIKIYQLKNN